MTHFKRIYEGGVVVTSLLLENLSEQISSDPDISVDDAIRKAAGKSGYKNLSSDAVIEIAKRLAEDHKKISEAKEADGESDKSSDTGKGMGTSEMKWIASLKPDELCMFVAEYDYEKAYHLYTEVDKDVVAQLAELKQKGRWNNILSSFESTMYGFGGHYKSDKSSTDSENEKVYNVNSEQSDGPDDQTLAAIRSMGF